MTIARKITFAPHLHKLVIDGTKTVTRCLKTNVREGQIVAAVTGWRTMRFYDDSPPKSCYISANDGIKWEWEPQGTWPKEGATSPGRYRPPMFFPRYLYHLAPLLRVTSVRMERLQQITFEDALREGVEEASAVPYGDYQQDTIEAFAALWDSVTTAPGTRWADNPELSRVEFEPVKGGNQ